MNYSCPSCNSADYDDVLGVCVECGHNAEDQPEPERCIYCGGMFVTPCDEPPRGPCEQAMNAP